MGSKLPLATLSLKVSSEPLVSIDTRGGFRSFAASASPTGHEGGSRHPGDVITACRSALPQGSSEPRAGIHLSKVTAKEVEDTGMLVILVLEEG